MKYNNIIYITGDDSWQIDTDLQGLEKIFGEKYGSINIEHHRLEDFKNFPIQNLTARDLLSEKKLFIFRGSQIKESPKNQKKNTNRFENILEKIAGEIPNETVLLFAYIGKEDKNLKQWLKKNATLREKQFSWNISHWNKLTDLDEKVLKSIIATYKKHESLRDKYDTNFFLAHEIMHSIKMAEILQKSGESIDTNTMQKIIHGYEGGHLFEFIDTILKGDIKSSLAHLQRIKNYESGEFYKFLAGCISSIRNSAYIICLRDVGKTQKEIQESVKIHPFIIQKSYQSTLKSKSIAQFHKKIISTKIAYQQGKGMKKNELGILFEIEIALLNLKK